MKNNSIANWIKSSNYDMKTADHMFDTGRYIYVLFMCHLAVEKTLKALYEAIIEKVPPRTHNLVYLSNAIGLELPENQVETLEALNGLSIVTRYPEDINALIKAFKKDRVAVYLNKTKELLKWLKKEPRLKN